MTPRGVGMLPRGVENVVQGVENVDADEAETSLQDPRSPKAVRSKIAKCCAQLHRRVDGNSMKSSGVTHFFGEVFRGKMMFGGIHAQNGDGVSQLCIRLCQSENGNRFAVFCRVGKLLADLQNIHGGELTNSRF